MSVPNEPIVPPPSPPPVDTPPRDPDRAPGEEPLPDPEPDEGAFAKRACFCPLPDLGPSLQGRSSSAGGEALTTNWRDDLRLKLEDFVVNGAKQVDVYNAFRRNSTP
ncbi:hypothetical protein GCM10010520_52350 [Rhizobium viscosum]|uniref:Uncharacterized protein n=1 Tax=Rhizobium viscosum TaxID=1673 RepID=A0ABR9IZ04_RHIVS|nr:hypothetical protein [Rhizobium viscosum]